ncbi:WD40-repeat-containing domain protein [Suillus bovinus]|uniref:WD40-repeat-containing domain protein n=1 Tax=Suillus bovinus TaxID=48563 RepID=UPI001B86283D|nr:WD40-repeat-containing domain protein [Suillus bovinus]KAG2154419.1 WD40-repeat-containing domain protein [Suillus bovinus]
MIATGGYKEDGIKIWDAKTGKLLSTVKHEYAVWSLAWTSNENKLISGSGNGSLRIFDTATWQEIAVLDGHKQVVEAIALFRNDRLLASTSWDKTARLWNLDNNLSIGLPLKHAKDVEFAAFSADGKMLSTACADENAYVWDIHAILTASGLQNLLSIPAQQSGLNKKKSDAIANAGQRPASLPLPGLLDDLQDCDRFPTSNNTISHPLVHRRRHASAPFWESRPRTLQVRLLQIFHPPLAQLDPDESIELQQHSGPSTSSFPTRLVGVAAQQDNQVSHVALPPEQASDKEKRIKKSTWWNRFILFLFCASHSSVDGPNS